MKLLFILLAVLLSAASSAAPHYHRTRPRVPAATRIIRAVPWKTVAAGGAAAGTVVAAYKNGSGVEEGMATAAKEAPVAFLSSITLSSLFIPLIVVIGVPIAGIIIWQKLSS